MTGQSAPVERPDAGHLEFRILGSLEICRDGEPVPLPTPRAQAVLVVLLVHANHVVSVDQLCDELWHEQPPRTARSAVHVHIAALRRALGAAASLQTRTGGYLLQLDDQQLDALRFEHELRSARSARERDSAHARERLHAALALWRGPALSEFTELPCARPEAARLEELRMEAIEQRVDIDLATGQSDQLVAELKQLIAEHPYRERLHAQLMLALYRADRQADALDAYRDARQLLVEQLGIEPGDELRKLQRAILAHDPAIEPPPARAMYGSDHAFALPAPPNALFGREADLDALTLRVRELGTRLVTLVGAGGVGKTRLAIEAARRLAPDFCDGARVVSLAAVSDPRDVAGAIAQRLDVPAGEDEKPETAVQRWLDDRDVLLVLDNFEHVLDAAPLVGELIRACRGQKIVVTSREPLRLSAERVYPVRPLVVPDTSAVTAQAVGRSSAVALFCDRAGAQDPAFRLDDSNAEAIGEICRRLDGVPLALELGAARVGVLTPHELNRRLDQALTVLVGGMRDAPPRQRTLRATIDWSHNLLGDAERQVFARMAVCAGGATVAAAEEVTGASLETLESLTAKQLLQRCGERLVMLETVREYARERLGEQPDRTAIEQRLAGWCLRLLRDANAQAHVVQPGRARRLAALDAELPNTLGALSRALNCGDAEIALQLVGELGHYWDRTRRWDDATRWIDAGLELAGERFPHLRATVLLHRFRLTNIQRHDKPQRSDIETSLALYRAAGDLRGVAACLNELAFAAAWAGSYGKAAAFSDEAIRCARIAGDEMSIATALARAVSSSADYEETERRALQAIGYLRRVDNVERLNQVCSTAGYAAIVEGRYREALAWIDDEQAAAVKLEDARSNAYAQCNRGLALLFLGDLDGAAPQFRAALAKCIQTRAELIDEALLGLAAVEAQRERPTLAAQLAGAAKRYEARRMVAEDVVWTRLVNGILAPARDRHGPEHWDAGERAGAALTIQEAIELAVEPQPVTRTTTRHNQRSTEMTRIPPSKMDEVAMVTDVAREQDTGIVR